MAFSLVALVLFARELLGRLARVGAIRLAAPRLGVRLTAGLLVVVFLTKIAMLWFVAQHYRESWSRGLPITIPPLAPAGHADAIAVANVLLAVGEAFLLWCLAAGVDSDAPRRYPRTILASGSMMAVIALGAPILTAPDAYLSVGYSLTGLGAYHPPALPFHGDLQAINHVWGTPIIPSLYGPLWIGIISGALSFVPGLLGKLLALRTLALLAFSGTLATLAGMRLPRSIVALVALNPDWWLQLVTNAHADVLAVLFAALAGAAIVHKRPAWAVVGTVAAGLVKLPYAIACLAMFILSARREERIRYSALSLGCSLLVTAALARAGLLIAFPRTLHALHGNVADPIHLTAAVLAVVVLFAGLVLRLRFRTGGWLFPAWGPAPLPWYLTLGVPYAAATRREGTTFLIIAPIAMLLQDAMFYRPWLGEVSFVLALIWAVTLLPLKMGGVAAKPKTP
jgi:hypothetical protein